MSTTGRPDNPTNEIIRALMSTQEFPQVFAPTSFNQAWSVRQMVNSSLQGKEHFTSLGVTAFSCSQ